MKYYKRLKLYKASNVSFNPEKCLALSYDWWQFVKRIGGKIVVNSYRYSPTTGNHQNKVSRLMRQLGIEPDAIIECPAGLQDLSSAKGYYEYCIKGLQEAMAKQRSHVAKNIERKCSIKNYEIMLATINALIDEENKHV